MSFCETQIESKLLFCKINALIQTVLNLLLTKYTLQFLTVNRKNLVTDTRESLLRLAVHHWGVTVQKIVYHLFETRSILLNFCKRPIAMFYQTLSNN